MAYEASTRDTQEPTGWVGCIVFASMMMIIVGSLNIFYGIVALVDDTWVGWANRNHVFLDISTWGWVLIIMGTIVLFSGIGVLSGNVLARTVGVLAAGLSLLVNVAFLPAHPVWALTVITIDVLVIWALTAHGGEMRQES